MKVLFLSFIVGLGVGVLYGLIRVKSPAPPIVALLGLLGMVVGEQFGTWIQTKKLDVSRAASVCLTVNATTVSFTILHPYIASDLL
jgi:XapX domain-containing protein